jgi:hypothetical protein
VGALQAGAQTVQRALSDSKQEVLRPHGVLYPSTDRGARPLRHVSVRRAVTSNDAQKRDAEYSALMSEFDQSGATTMVLSDEDLLHPLRALPEFFGRFSRDFDILVVCFLQRTDFLIEATYEQSLRWSRYRGAVPIADFWADPENQPRFDSHHMLSLWRDQGFSLKVIDHAQTVAAGTGVVNAFLHAAGLAALGPIDDGVAEAAIDFRLMLLMTLLSADPLQEDQQVLMKALTKAASGVARRRSYAPLPGVLGKLERAAVLESFQLIHESLAADYGIHFGNELVAGEGDPPVKVPELGYVLSLIGQLSDEDAVRFQQACQGYLLARLSESPDEDD